METAPPELPSPVRSRNPSIPMQPTRKLSHPTPQLDRIASGSAFAASPSNSLLSSLSESNNAKYPSPNPRELLKLAGGVIKSRNGSVLSRGFILKADYRPTSTSKQGFSTPFAGADDNRANEGGGASTVGGGVHLRGATNFRMADSDLGVFGCAQPTETGLRTVLSVLKSQSTLASGGSPMSPPSVKGKGRETVWFCTREEPIVYIGVQPFVLRDSQAPTKTYALSDRAENLEAIEKRLKQDILKEGAKYGGVILVQEEIGDQEILNTWVAVDSVRTVREVWEQVAAEGYNVAYHRVPITRDQSPDDRYLDTYISILADIPTSSSLVFNCGLGVVRTSFAMSAALIVRRRQMMLEGAEDPYEDVLSESSLLGDDSKAAKALRARLEQGTRDQSLLRLMNVLQNSLAASGQSTLISLLSSQPRLLENLRTALLGNYELILSLLSCLDDGIEQKKLVDTVIDSCDAVINLRESVLQHRVRHASLALLDEESSRSHRSKALAALERYFFLVAFSSFVDSSPQHFPVKFSSWLDQRPEINNMISRMRKSGHFYVFSPVHDLSAIAKRDAGSSSATTMMAKGKFADAQSNGCEVVGDEWAQQLVRNRSGIILRAGMILKNDQWRASSDDHEPTIRGAINFRRVPASSLYALSQPTQDGIVRVLQTVRKNMQHEDGSINWLNLREEPLIYVNGTPYVLRLEAVSLRNVKSYVGISSSRLELLEDRLKSDVLAEVKAFDGRLLLHTEADDGSVHPVWEVIESDSCVQTLREVMDEAARKANVGLTFIYKRIPITAEKSPDFADIRAIVELVAQLDVEKSAIIVNCQLGRGRSTRAQIIVSLVQQWLQSGGHRLPASGPDSPRSTRYSYTVINNLLRVIRSGQEIKNFVDSAITSCGGTYDLLDSIEEARQAAEDTLDNAELKLQRTERGIQNLRAYYFLILFASFLNESKAETWRDLCGTANYEHFVKDRPVFKTIERELDTAGLEALIPLEKPLVTGNALSDEVAEFVAKRSGRILSQATLLKSDYFSGLQKMSLPERVDGVPNFRRARLLFTSEGTGTPLKPSFDFGPLVYGTGMPTVDGLRHGLERMGAREKDVIWTSMREEPVIFVSGGRPHVLRLFEAPLENVVTTGVTADIVEEMEMALKRDLQLEAAENGGKVLLHDEIEEPNGSFTITATWEEVKPEDILTPKEVFALMRSEGLRVDYERLPVTDEQAPIPQIYSRIEQRVSTALQSDAALAFNCQMGRGRTSTGMVAAALVSNISFNKAGTSDLSASVVELDASPENMAWDGRETDPYLQGEYKVILQIVGVLSHGKLAKKLTDRAIDVMDGVQNLRRAVYDFKLRAEAADVGSNKHRKIYEQASQYLYRYATLIIFANYLLEKAESATSKEEDEDTNPVTPAFKEWLRDRREISYILSRRTLD